MQVMLSHQVHTLSVDPTQENIGKTPFIFPAEDRRVGWDLSQPTFGRYITPMLIVREGGRRRDRSRPPYSGVPNNF